MLHIPTTPMTTSWSHYSAVPASSSEPCALGVDEAGRGPVLGPMVYAVSYHALSRTQDLLKVGFNDSKVLNESQRDSLFEKIEESDWIGWGIAVCSPQDISSNMLAKYPLFK